MKWNLLIASLILILFAFACDELDVSENQTGSFIKYYNNSPVFTAADVKQVNGSGFAILGTARLNDSSQICLLRTDEFGNTIGPARYYPLSENDQAYCLQVLDDGGFGILGSSLNTSTQHLEVYFIRTNSVGDVTWSRIIGQTGNVEAMHFEVDDQGSFYMTGYTEVIDVVDYGRQIWMFALNADGSNMWSSPKISGGLKDDEGRHIQILDGGYLAITGYTKSYPTGTLFGHAFILKANSSGQVSDMYYAPSSADEEGNCIRVMDNNHYLILGTLKRGAESEISLHYVSLSDREVIWEQTYGGTGIDIGNCVITEGSSIYILGTTATSGINSAISLITTDIFGNQTARSDFGLESQFSGSSFERTADGGFIIAGTNKHSDISISVAIIKTGIDTSL